MPFPRAKDYHKPEQPMIPNCYGIFYSLVSVCYWFALSFLGIMRDEALALSTSVLFGSTMGLLDDMIDLRWRYKAILPIFAALPYVVLNPSERFTIVLPLIGFLNLGPYFLMLLVPVIVTVTTNTYNQLGGLNGLETLSGLIILVGMALTSGSLILMIVPIICLSALGYLNYNGKLFIGNVGTFSIGLSLAVYAILMNLKLFLLVSLIPFILNSFMILFYKYIQHDRADTFLDEKGMLFSYKARSLRTLILRYKRLNEHQLVALLCSIVAFFTALAFLQKTFF